LERVIAGDSVKSLKEFVSRRGGYLLGRVPRLVQSVRAEAQRGRV